MPYNPYGYQMPNYYGQPMPDQLTQLRQNAGYQAPMMSQPTGQSSPSTPPIIWVQGEEGAKAYMVAAGNSVLLMDSENSAFYIKSTDASGMPLPLRAFDYKERTTAAKMPAQAVQQPGGEFVTRAEFDALAARCEALNSATAIVTPAAAGNYFNVFAAAFIEVPRGCCVTVAVENTSTQAIDIANSNLIVERVA